MAALWSKFKSIGLLPFPGSLIEQPAFIVEALSLCEDTKNTIDAEAVSKEQRRATV